VSSELSERPTRSILLQKVTTYFGNLYWRTTKTTARRKMKVMNKSEKYNVLQASADAGNFASEK